MEQRESKSNDVQPISKTNPHKFDLNKPYYDEEEIHPNEVLEQKESKSENIQSIVNKTVSTTTRKFDLNKLYYDDEEELHPSNGMAEARLEMLKILLPKYFKVCVIFKICCDIIQ